MIVWICLYDDTAAAVRWHLTDVRGRLACGKPDNGRTRYGNEPAYLGELPLIPWQRRRAGEAICEGCRAIIQPERQGAALDAPVMALVRYG